jgi:hypothetical protein
MKKISIFTLAIAASSTALLIACNQGTASKQVENDPAKNTAAMVGRGEYLVNSIGCDDCHSPKKMGPNGPEVIAELRLSGYPGDRPAEKADTNSIKKGWTLFGSDFTSAAGEWGMSFAANLTSDASGIGNWKEEQFLRAIKEGKFKGLESGRPLLPPMPWFVYKNLTDEDLKSIFAYLKTVKPVKNVVPAPISYSNL